MEFIGKRISWLRKEDELSIVISSAPSKGQAYYWLVWCLLWTLCGGIVLSYYFRETDENRKIFFIVFMAFWLYFEFRSVYKLFWKWRGREVIKVRSDAVFVGKRIFGKGKALRFTYNGIQELKKIVASKTSPLNIIKSTDFFASTNRISLQYFGKEYSFGNELSDEDTGELFALIKREIRKIKKD